MNVFQMRDKLKERLKQLDVKFSFNRDDETLRIYRVDNGKGVTIKLNAIVAKYKQQQEKIVEEIVYYAGVTCTKFCKRKQRWRTICDR